MNCVTNTPIDFESIKHVMLRGERANIPSSSYNSIIRLFNDRAFNENPYQYTIEHLLDHYTTRPALDFSSYRLIQNLPNFDENASIDLLQKIAAKRFAKDPQFKEIMEVFKRSLHHPEFAMRFEYGKNKCHIEVGHIAFAVRSLFDCSRRLEFYSITQQQIHDHFYGDMCE